MSIGSAAAVAALRTQRCGATNVDPATALRDRNLPAALMRAFDHPDMGVYVEMNESGHIAVGDFVACALSGSIPSSWRRPARALDTRAPHL